MLLNRRASLYRLLSLWLPLLASMPAQAVDTYARSTIKDVYPLGDGSIVLIFTTRNAACTNNGNNDPYFYVRAGVNGMTSDGVKAVLATALTAAALNRPVSYVWDSSNQSLCPINRMSAEFH